MTIHRMEARRIFLRAIKRLDGNVLEIGYGDSHFFLKYSDCSLITGLEVNERIHRSALNEAKHLRNVSVALGRYDSLPFQENAFDFVVASFTFCCIENLTRNIEEIIRVTKNNGILLSFDHFNRPGMFSRLVKIGSPLYKSLSKSNCDLNFHHLNAITHTNLHPDYCLESSENLFPWVYNKYIIIK